MSQNQPFKNKFFDVESAPPDAEAIASLGKMTEREVRRSGKAMLIFMGSLTATVIATVLTHLAGRYAANALWHDVFHALSSALAYGLAVSGIICFIGVVAWILEMTARDEPSFLCKGDPNSQLAYFGGWRSRKADALYALVMGFFMGAVVAVGVNSDVVGNVVAGTPRLALEVVCFFATSAVPAMTGALIVNFALGMSATRWMKKALTPLDPQHYTDEVFDYKQCGESFAVLRTYSDQVTAQGRYPVLAEWAQFRIWEKSGHRRAQARHFLERGYGESSCS